MTRSILAVLWLLQAAMVTYAQGHVLTAYNTNNSPLPDNNIRALALATDSSLWIGTENGLVMLKNGNWTVIDTLQGYSIRSIAFDTGGNAWVGTFLNGLWLETDTGWMNYTAANSSLPDDYVRTIAFCPNGDAWLGTVGGAVHIANGNWTVYNQNNTNWFTQHVASSFCAADNSIWLGGINSGLMHQVDTGWVIYRTIATGLPDNTILDIKGTPNGDFWLAMPAAGAAIFDGNLGWVYYNTTTSFNPSNSINKVLPSNNGYAYLASSDKGVVIYQGGLTWTNLSATENPDTNGYFLPANEILALVQDAEGTLWASANNAGLIQINFIKGVTAVNPLNALPTIAIFPNPANEVVTIALPEVPTQLTVTSITGQAIFTATIYGGQTKIPLSTWPKGIYMFVLQTRNGVVTHRIVKY